MIKRTFQADSQMQSNQPYGIVTLLLDFHILYIFIVHSKYLAFDDSEQRKNCAYSDLRLCRKFVFLCPDDCFTDIKKDMRSLSLMWLNYNSDMGE